MVIGLIFSGILSGLLAMIVALGIETGMALVLLSYSGGGVCGAFGFLTLASRRAR